MNFWAQKFNSAGALGYLNWMPDKLYLKILFRLRMGYRLSLKHPRTFSEKLQWLKLYDRKPLYNTMVDKAEAKKYVAERIGDEYIIPTLGVWERFDDIDFDALPDRFVLKCTHDSGGLVICRDKASLDKQKAKEKIERSLQANYFWSAREWQYKDVPHRIIAEVYMEDDETNELRDYKFFCFDGEVRALFIASERQSENEETKFDFFDCEFQHLSIKNGHPNATIVPKKPICFEEMKRLASELSRGIPQLRIDFYEVNGRVYFGELTFAHWSGMVPFDPPEWDRTFGDWITLPTDKQD